MLREDVVEPLATLRTGWAIRLSSEDRCSRNTVFAQNETVDVDNQIVPWITKVMPLFREGQMNDQLFSFTCPEFLLA